MGSGSAFRDVPAGRWYSDAITWAHTAGIVVGYGDGTFGPHDTLTREQMAVLLYRYAGYPDGRYHRAGRPSTVSQTAARFPIGLTRP